MSISKKIKLVILKNEHPDDHLPWVEACDIRLDEIEYAIVDLTMNKWMEEIQAHKADCLLAKPSGLTANFKQLYDERISILDKILGCKIYPSPEEIYIYENKRLLSYWLKANEIPHPETHVFYNQQDAQNYIYSSNYPIVAKTNIGASGSGISLLKTKDDAIAYIKLTFSGKGAPQRTGPNLAKGRLINRGMHYIFNPKEIRKKLNIYESRRNNLQKYFVIFQAYIPHDFEWRVVRIGDSFFAHKKLKLGEKASGSLLKGYENPPLRLFDFVKKITDKYKFYSQAVDIFETENGLLVNEMQCIFGQSDPYQMLVDGKPGRYYFLNDNWVFEKGNFTTNECYDLRLKHVLNWLATS